MDNESDLYSRTWPQVIRGESTHLTELMDGDFPTEATWRQRPQSGNRYNDSLGYQQSLQYFDKIQIFLIASAVTGPWGGSGGGTRRKGGGSSLFSIWAPCRANSYNPAWQHSGRLPALFLQETMRYLFQDAHQWWEQRKPLPFVIKPANHHVRMSAAVCSPVGVSLISFWPGDPEVSILRSTSADSHSPPDDVLEEAALDAKATEILKSNSRLHICVLLEPLVPGLAQFITESSRKSDFMEKVISDQRGLDRDELYNRYCSFHRLLFKKNVCVLACVYVSVHICNQENFPSVFSDFKRAAKTPEALQETVPGGVTSAAPGDFNPYGSGELRLWPVLLQPKEQHEGTGGSVSCSSCRATPATLWLLPVRSPSFTRF